MPKEFKQRQLMAFGLAILPAVLLGILILKYQVNVPFLDQWDVAPYIIKSAAHERVSLANLIAQHNESRLFFPRLFFMGLAYLTDWDVRYEMLFIFLLACLVSLNIYYLSKFTIEGSLSKRILILFIANLLIFSPIQHDNWLWGIQIVAFIPITCISTGIAIAYSQLGTKTKFILCMCLSAISTFSYANGILSWIVVFPVLAVNSWKHLRAEKWLAFVWWAGFISNAILYFYNYRKPVAHPSLATGFLHPERTLNFFFAFLGSPLGFKNLIVSTIVGIVLVLTAIASFVYLFKRRNLWQKTIGWLAIAAYSAISASVTALGRVGFGVDEALSSKYTTFSLYFTVALIYLVTIIFESAGEGDFFKEKKRLFAPAITIGVIFIILYAFCWDNALGRMNTWRRERLQGKACLLFINVMPEEKCLNQKVYPSVLKVKQTANAANKLGLIKPSLVKSNKIKEIASNTTVENYKYGKFESITKNRDVYLASGWARLLHRGEPADAVLLTYENAKAEATVFALVDRRNKRKDIAKATKNFAYSMSGWRKTFKKSSLPKGLVKIKAWAFDTNTGKAFKIGGTHILENK